MAWRGVAWRGVAWRGVAWRGVACPARVGRFAHGQSTPRERERERERQRDSNRPSKGERLACIMVRRQAGPAGKRWRATHEEPSGIERSTRVPPAAYAWPFERQNHGRPVCTSSASTEHPGVRQPASVHDHVATRRPWACRQILGVWPGPRARHGTASGVRDQRRRARTTRGGDAIASACLGRRGGSGGRLGFDGFLGRRRSLLLGRGFLWLWRRRRVHGLPQTRRPKPARGWISALPSNQGAGLQLRI